MGILRDDIRRVKGMGIRRESPDQGRDRGGEATIPTIPSSPSLSLLQRDRESEREGERIGEARNFDTHKTFSSSSPPQSSPTSFSLYRDENRRAEMHEKGTGDKDFETVLVVVSILQLPSSFSHFLSDKTNKVKREKEERGKWGKNGIFHFTVFLFSFLFVIL